MCLFVVVCVICVCLCLCVCGVVFVFLYAFMFVFVCVLCTCIVCLFVSSLDIIYYILLIEFIHNPFSNTLKVHQK